MKLSGSYSTDPYYVHQQGLYFDGTNYIQAASSTTGVLFGRSSFTVEFWFRPYQAFATGQYLLEKESSAGSTYFSLQLLTGSKVRVTLNGQNLDFSTTYTNGTSYFNHIM